MSVVVLAARRSGINRPLVASSISGSRGKRCEHGLCAGGGRNVGRSTLLDRGGGGAGDETGEDGKSSEDLHSEE